jgi:uncharacterized protein YndB with AHSA1/START domain
MSENKATNSLNTSVEGDVLVIERIFNAPRDLVFKAFSDSELLAKWWGPKGWQTENRKLEFKPDGVWHYCMRCTDKDQGEFYGQESWGKGVFHEIAVPEKIVYTDTFSDEEGNTVEVMPAIRITMNFVEQNGQTKIISRNQFVSAEALQQVMEMGIVHGVSSQYERLDELLVELQ